MNVDLDWLRSQFPVLSELQPLAGGGQKRVFSANHPTDGPVVLKLIALNHNPESVAREILAVQQVSSNRVPKILEHGQLSTSVGDCLWLREHRVGGHTVRQCVQNGPLNTSDVLRLGLHVLETLAASEQVKIVHRDIKPDNLIRDGNGGFWVLDFGLARHLTLESLTATAQPFGKVTWGYSPPEQCRNVKPDIDSRADLFALGVTLYECATGSNPFRDGARTHLEILDRVEKNPLPRLNLPIVSAGEFAELVSAMTQKQRVHRPSTVAEAFNWIAEICTRESIQ